MKGAEMFSKIEAIKSQKKKTDAYATEKKSTTESLMGRLEINTETWLDNKQLQCCRSNATKKTTRITEKLTQTHPVYRL